MNIHFFNDLKHEIISINFVVKVGNITYYDNYHNFAHLIEHLLFHAHPKFSQYELMVKIEEMGGLINAEVNEYYTELYIKIHKNYLLNVLELIFEALVNFDISEDDYRNELQILQVEENERQIVNTEMMTCILNDIFSNFFFNSHPSYEQIKEIYNKLYLKHWILIINGQVNKQDKDMIYSLYGRALSNNEIVYNNVFQIKPSPIIKSNDIPIGKEKLFYYFHICNKNTDILIMRLIKKLYIDGLSSILYDTLVAEKELTYSLFFKEYISKMSKHFIIYFFHEKKLSNKIQNYIHDVFSISYIKNIDDIHFLRIRNTLITEYMLKKDRVSSVLNDRVTSYLFSDNMILTDKKIEYLANMTIHKMKHAIMQSLAGD